ncbi:MAG: hypothetical protein U0457_06545 [Candidatus Sericytochromatia bacterium]
MKKIFLTTLFSIFLSSNAYALDKNTQLDFKLKTSDKTSEYSIYYSGDIIKTSEKTINSKYKKDNKNNTHIRIFDSKKHENYSANYPFKEFDLIKNFNNDRFILFNCLGYQFSFNDINNLQETEKKLLDKKFVKLSDEKIILANREFDCIVFEGKYNSKDKNSNEMKSTSKIWIDKKLMFFVKRSTSEIINGEKLDYNMELASIKENVNFEKNFFSTKDAKIWIDNRGSKVKK